MVVVRSSAIGKKKWLCAPNIKATELKKPSGFENERSCSLTSHSFEPKSFWTK